MGTGTGETSGSPGSGQPQPGSALHRLPGTRRRQRPGRRWPNGGASAKARKERKSPAERTKALPKHSPEERGDAPDDAAAARPKPRSGGRATGADTQASWPPARPLPGHTCRVRRGRRRGRGRRTDGRLCGQTMAARPPCPPGTGQAADSGGGSGRPHRRPRRHKQTRRVRPAPPAVPLTGSRRPDQSARSGSGGPHTGDRNSKRNYFQKAGAPKSGDHRLKQ